LRTPDLCDSEGLPLTQEYLAEMIGVRRHAISIVVHAFQQAGLVSYSRRHIETRDNDRVTEDVLRVLRERLGRNANGC
jgi:Mn-dependent DtxR family transcriptional regulator